MTGLIYAITIAGLAWLLDFISVWLEALQTSGAA